ncbi:MAG: peptide/nickel transport system permease protein [Gaiellaceae bacterium]|nr:peptide/nickel transport system permease protein [Gaiellaceae bacterium]
MFRYLVRRILWAMLLFLVITFVTFVIFYVGPNNPARAVCGGEQAKRACLVQATRKLGLNKPMPVQYYRFLKKLVIHQDLGTSFATSQSVNQRIKEAAPVTASLVLGGAVLWMIIGLSVGIFSALKPRSLLDRAAMVFVLIGVSAHPVWIGLIFEYVFGVKLGWTPIANYANFFGAPGDSGLPGGPWQWFYHLILPWCTFALLFAALYVRMIRANVMETLNEDFVRTARAKGAPERQVLISHVLRNALLPVVTMLGMDIGIALGGAIFTETVYQLPGLGQTAIIGISNQDLAIVQGVIVFATVAIIIFNLLVDLLYAWIDPRIRLT